jgi:hypothetical protein
MERAPGANERLGDGIVRPVSELRPDDPEDRRVIEAVQVAERLAVARFRERNQLGHSALG